MAETMLALWNDTARAIEMGKAARVRVETHFGPDVHYEKMMAIYERVMA
jgi:hypothetical protein